MSAQAGVWNFDEAPASREVLANISQTISQYGPDGEQTYFSGPMGMLYRPFHTTKESRLERQPHVSSHGKVVMWDGRLDNREELIPQLRGDLSADLTDLAIVVAAFERWGPDCFCKVVGDWALSIWDPIQKDVILARDYIGVRHLYYYPTSKRVMWCTYLAPLVLSGDQFTLNDEYIAGYLALYPEAHLTPYREIHAVPPGKFVRIREGKATIHPYWAFHPEVRIRHKTDAEYEEHFRVVFRQAVRRRLRSDSPILAELSGGLDSSSIVCMADDILDKEGTETPRLDTLSFYDPREPDGDERPYFSKVEATRGRMGYHCDAGAEVISIPQALPTFFPCPGSLGDEKVQATDFRRKLIREHKYRVSLSGIGGDEFLGGVPRAGPQLADLILEFRPAELARQLMAWSFAKRRPWIQLLGEACVLLLPVWARARLTSDAKVATWIDADFARRNRFRFRQLGPIGDYGFTLCSRREYAQTVVALSWQMSSSAIPFEGSEERRYPYLDQNLLEFLLAIPANQLLRPGERRSLMRRALAGLLPREIVHRKTKAVSVRKFITGVQANWETLEALLYPGASSRFGFLNPSRFHQDLLRAKHGDAPQLVRMVKVIALELWLQDVIDRGLVKAPRLHTQQRAGPDLVELRPHA